MKAFIPAWLDDHELTPAEFRIYCHLCRRANKNTQIAWPSYDEMITCTGMGKSTIRRSIDRLIRLKLVQKLNKKFGDSCRYLICPKVSPEGQMEDSNSSTQNTSVITRTVPPQDFNDFISEPSMVPPEEQEGNPSKVNQLRLSNRVSSIEHSTEQLEFAEWFKLLLPKNQQDRLPTNWLSDWCKIYGQLVRIDKRDPIEIREVCQWGRGDPFWKPNFGSPAKLRKRNPDGTLYFDVFAEKMKQSTSKKDERVIDTKNRPATYEEI